MPSVKTEWNKPKPAPVVEPVVVEFDVEADCQKCDHAELCDTGELQCEVDED